MSQEICQRAAQKLIAFHREAEQRNEWTFFVDEMYARECVYVCEYAGTMRVCANGIDEIKATGRPAKSTTPSPTVRTGVPIGAA